MIRQVGDTGPLGDSLFPRLAFVGAGIALVLLLIVTLPFVGHSLLGGDPQDTSPQLSFTFEYHPEVSPSVAKPCDSFGDDGVLTITHDGGDHIRAGVLNIVDGRTTNKWLVPDVTETWNDCANMTTSEVVAASNATRIAVDSDDITRIKWVSESGEKEVKGEWVGSN